MQKLKVPTHHITAEPGKFAKTVLMPGDPLRAKMIADTYFEDAVCVNETRGMLAYTGYYKGKRLSVMGSGMGTSSIANHAYTLYHGYEVDTIIRLGTCGGFQDYLELWDVIIAQASCYEPSYDAQYHFNGTFAPIADFGLLERAVTEASRQGVPFHVGNFLTTTAFYHANQDDKRIFAEMGCLGSDQEAATLYMTAAHAGRKALVIDTVVGHVWRVDDTRKLTALERQEACRPMVEIALEIAEGS